MPIGAKTMIFREIQVIRIQGPLAPPWGPGAY